MSNPIYTINLRSQHGNIFAVIGITIRECKERGVEPPTIEKLLSLGEYDDIINYIIENYSNVVRIEW